MEFISKLKKDYGINRPILLEEIKELLSEYSKARVFQLISVAVKSGELEKFDSGVYYISAKSYFGKTELNPKDVAEKKYITDGKNRYGFYTGLALLNKFDLTTQMPNIIEIATNKEATRGRRIEIGGQKIIVKKSRTEITDKNADVLMLLEVFNLVDGYNLKKLSWQKLKTYAKEQKITAADIINYTKFVPAKAVKNLLQSGVLNEIA